MVILTMRKNASHSAERAPIPPCRHQYASPNTCGAALDVELTMWSNMWHKSVVCVRARPAFGRMMYDGYLRA